MITPTEGLEVLEVQINNRTMNKIKMMLNDPKVLIAIAFIFGMTLVSMSEVANPGYGLVPGMGMIILGATLFITGFAYAYAGIDVVLIKKLAYINHTKRFIIRASVALGFSFITLRCICWDVIWLTIFQGAIFWVVFEIFLNKKRENPTRAWNYMATGENAPLPERWFNGYWQIQLIIKAIFLLYSFIMLMS